MATRTRRTEYCDSDAAKRLRVPVAAFRWAAHAGIVPAPDVNAYTWSRAAVEAMDRDAIEAAMPGGAVGTYPAACMIANALGTPNPPGDTGPDVVKGFTVRQLACRGLLTSLSGLDAAQFHPAQVAEVCRRPDLAELVAEETPLGPDQAAARLEIRRSDWDHVVRLGWIEPAEVRQVSFGTSKAGAVDVPIYRAADVDAVPVKHPEVDWDAVRSLGKGQRSPLAKLR